TRTREPASRPPPSTRSSSASPEPRRAPSDPVTSASGVGPAGAPPAAPAAHGPRPASRRFAGAAAGASEAVFHAPQAGQRPNQRAASWPQPEQKKRVDVRFGISSLEYAEVEVLLRVLLDVIDEDLERGHRGPQVVVELGV